MGPQDTYIETVFTCEGDYYDPNLHVKLKKFKQTLTRLLLKEEKEKQKLILKKVEPWNSVRVTFNIPKEAALRLKQLAERGDHSLRDLGVLAVQIEGDQLISLTIAGQNNERTELVFRTSEVVHTAAEASSVFDISGSENDDQHLQGAQSMDSTRKNIAQYLSQGGALAQGSTSIFDSVFSQPSTSGEVFKSPNTVVTRNDPIPFYPTSQPLYTSPERNSLQNLPRGKTPTGYPSPSASHASPGREHLSPTGTKLSPASHGQQHHHQFMYPPYAPNNLNLPRPTNKVSTSSPLLVNLLQMNMSDGMAGHANNVPPYMKSPMIPPFGVAPPKKKRRVRKPKDKLPVTSTITSTEEVAIESVLNPAMSGINPALVSTASTTTTSSATIAMESHGHTIVGDKLSPGQEKIVNPYTGQLESVERDSNGTFLDRRNSPDKTLRTLGGPIPISVDENPRVPQTAPPPMMRLPAAVQVLTNSYNHSQAPPQAENISTEVHASATALVEQQLPSNSNQLDDRTLPPDKGEQLESVANRLTPTDSGMSSQENMVTSNHKTIEDETPVAMETDIANPDVPSSQISENMAVETNPTEDTQVNDAKPSAASQMLEVEKIEPIHAVSSSGEENVSSQQSELESQTVEAVSVRTEYAVQDTSHSGNTSPIAGEFKTKETVEQTNQGIESLQKLEDVNTPMSSQEEKMEHSDANSDQLLETQTTTDNSEEISLGERTDSRVDNFDERLKGNDADQGHKYHPSFTVSVNHNHDSEISSQSIEEHLSTHDRTNSRPNNHAGSVDSSDSSPRSSSESLHDTAPALVTPHQDLNIMTVGYALTPEHTPELPCPKIESLAVSVLDPKLNVPPLQKQHHLDQDVYETKVGLISKAGSGSVHTAHKPTTDITSLGDSLVQLKKAEVGDSNILPINGDHIPDIDLDSTVSLKPKLSLPVEVSLNTGQTNKELTQDGALSKNDGTISPQFEKVKGVEMPMAESHGHQDSTSHENVVKAEVDGGTEPSSISDLATDIASNQHNTETQSGSQHIDSEVCTGVTSDIKDTVHESDTIQRDIQQANSEEAGQELVQERVGIDETALESNEASSELVITESKEEQNPPKQNCSDNSEGAKSNEGVELYTGEHLTQPLEDTASSAIESVKDNNQYLNTEVEQSDNTFDIDSSETNLAKKDYIPQPDAFTVTGNERNPVELIEGSSHSANDMELRNEAVDFSEFEREKDTSRLTTTTTTSVKHTDTSYTNPSSGDTETDKSSSVSVSENIGNNQAPVTSIGENTNQCGDLEQSKLEDCSDKLILTTDNENKGSLGASVSITEVILKEQTSTDSLIGLKTNMAKTSPDFDLTVSACDTKRKESPVSEGIMSNAVVSNDGESSIVSVIGNVLQSESLHQEKTTEIDIRKPTEVTQVVGAMNCVDDAHESMSSDKTVSVEAEKINEIHVDVELQKSVVPEEKISPSRSKKGISIMKPLYDRDAEFATDLEQEKTKIEPVQPSLPPPPPLTRLINMSKPPEELPVTESTPGGVSQKSVSSFSIASILDESKLAPVSSDVASLNTQSSSLPISSSTRSQPITVHSSAFSKMNRGIIQLSSSSTAAVATNVQEIHNSSAGALNLTTKPVLTNSNAMTAPLFAFGLTESVQKLVPPIGHSEGHVVAAPVIKPIATVAKPMVQILNQTSKLPLCKNAQDGGSVYTYATTAFTPVQPSKSMAITQPMGLHDNLPSSNLHTPVLSTGHHLSSPALVNFPKTVPTRIIQQDGISNLDRLAVTAVRLSQESLQHATLASQPPSQLSPKVPQKPTASVVHMGAVGTTKVALGNKAPIHLHAQLSPNSNAKPLAGPLSPTKTIQIQRLPSTSTQKGGERTIIKLTVDPGGKALKSTTEEVGHNPLVQIVKPVPLPQKAEHSINPDHEYSAKPTTQIIRLAKSSDKSKEWVIKPSVKTVDQNAKITADTSVKTEQAQSTEVFQLSPPAERVSRSRKKVDVPVAEAPKPGKAVHTPNSEVQTGKLDSSEAPQKVNSQEELQNCVSSKPANPETTEVLSNIAPIPAVSQETLETKDVPILPTPEVTPKPVKMTRRSSRGSTESNQSTEVDKESPVTSLRVSTRGSRRSISESSERSDSRSASPSMKTRRGVKATELSDRSESPATRSTRSARQKNVEETPKQAEKDETSKTINAKPTPRSKRKLNATEETEDQNSVKKSKTEDVVAVSEDESLSGDIRSSSRLRGKVTRSLATVSKNGPIPTDESPPKMDEKGNNNKDLDKEKEPVTETATKRTRSRAQKELISDPEITVDSKHKKGGNSGGMKTETVDKKAASKKNAEHQNKTSNGKDSKEKTANASRRGGAKGNHIGKEPSPEPVASAKRTTRSSRTIKEHTEPQHTAPPTKRRR